ncbi:sulfurtransferase [Microbacterium sp. NPDC058389]|uniref:sulfurtransferase n=1 Tax=Microbacterium sp. NPDC058389 TaxID=3346475 RepID=UPI00365D5437
MASVLNISTYLFTRLDDIAALKPVLRERAVTAGLKGTILLAEEGINLFLAGDAEAVRGFVADLRRDPRFDGLTTKESWSQAQPFGRMIVKIKREIIRMDHPTIRPEAGRAPAVDPATLRRWLDEGADDGGREVVLLDTRNAFEVDYGAFDGALDWRIERFTEFPDAAAAAIPDLQGKTVVSYCTGGIRCEKAAIYLREIGVEAFQLEGGILGYFEHVGGAHWNGECFVFDEREALTPSLEPLAALRQAQGPVGQARGPVAQAPGPVGQAQAPVAEPVEASQTTPVEARA